MTSFRAKLRKIGTSFGIIIPRNLIEHYNVGEEIDIIMPEKSGSLEIPIVKEKEESFNTEWCTKHTGSMKGTCGCE
jgi:hypothetical protein